MMNKARIALFLGILCISIFPVMVRMNLTSGLISAFYRMAIATAIVLPVAFFGGKIKIKDKRELVGLMICGILFASDIAVWNVSIQNSSATQATLLTNLSPIWVGVISLALLKFRPKTSFWLGTIFALVGMVIFVGAETVLRLNFDFAFFLGILSGIFYALYILVSKSTLQKMDVITFLSISMAFSTVFLFLICLVFGEKFFGFTQKAWASLLIQGIVCQLIAWLLISYTTKRMRATRVSLVLLSQVVFAALLAVVFVDEKIVARQIIGGIVILSGIAMTFYEKRREVAE
ncbi:DMT family transporter [Chryseobacterium koreense]|uniref:DMT family transporter n=1 Tax=Chryseobacterium koreense TaxID=232216 RepID=UPI0026EC6E89|nr:DMT family transporter [Chryseobacterium koreense]